MLIKCKPCYNFQSVEFDWDYTVPEDLPEMFKFYEKVIKGLIEISPEQPDKIRKAPSEPLITEPQKRILDQYSIPYNSKMTQKEASNLIKKSMEEYAKRSK